MASDVTIDRVLDDFLAAQRARPTRSTYRAVMARRDGRRQLLENGIDYP